MILSFHIHIHVIRNDKTRQGFIVALRIMYVELVSFMV